MKIAIICPFFYPVLGGMEAYTFNLCLKLKEKGHEVYVFTSNLKRKGKFEKDKEMIKDLPVIRINTWFKIGDFGSFWPGIFLELMKKRFDIIHVHSYRHPHTNLAHIASKLKNTKFVITTHWPEYPKGLRSPIIEKIIPLYDKTLGKLLLKNSNLVIAVNKLEIPWLKARGTKNVVYIPNGIPDHYLIQRDEKKFREKYKIKGNMILCVGRLHKSKRYQFIIKAFPNVLKKYPDTKLVFVGPYTDYGDKLKNLSENLKIKDSVLFTDRVSEEEKMQAYAACDIFIHPSSFEAFGIVLLEAMSQKKPIIASRVGGIPGVVDEGKDGLLFNFGNIDQLTKKICYLLENKKTRKIIGEKGFEKAKKHQWSRIIDKIEAEYKKLLNNNFF
jgi:glycosyltransferase involved in cell wall biosynthesis